MSKRTAAQKIKRLIKLGCLGSITFSGICVYKGDEKFYSSFSSTDTDTKLSRAISPPVFKWYALQRKISEDGVSDLQVDLMPGFRLTWHYNKNLDLSYFKSEINKKFKM